MGATATAAAAAAATATATATATAIPTAIATASTGKTNTNNPQPQTPNPTPKARHGVQILVMFALRTSSEIDSEEAFRGEVNRRVFSVVLRVPVRAPLSPKRLSRGI